MIRKTIREQKRELLLGRLIDSSVKSFLEKGFDNVTINEIASDVGISQRSFFRYFPNKEDLVFHDLPRRHGIIRDILTGDADAIPPFDRIRNCIETVGDDYQNHREAILAELTIVAGSPYLKAIDLSNDARLEMLFVDCLRNYRGQPYLSGRQAMMAGSAIFGALRVLVWDWIGKGASPSTRQAVRDGIRFVDGLSSAFSPGSEAFQFDETAASAMPESCPD